MLLSQDQEEAWKNGFLEIEFCNVSIRLLGRFGRNSIFGKVINNAQSTALIYRSAGNVQQLLSRFDGLFLGLRMSVRKTKFMIIS